MINTGILRFLVYFSASAISASAFAQTPPTWAQSYGVGSYGGNGKPLDDPFYGSGFDHPVAMAKMPDGGVVVAGRLDLPQQYVTSTGSGGTNSRADATLVRFARDGTVLWQRTLIQLNWRLTNGDYRPGPSHVGSIKTDAQGNVFITGGKGNPDNSGQVPFVAKFSASGELLWRNGISKVTGQFGSPAQNYETGLRPVGHMSLTSDGGVLVPLHQTRPNSAYGTYALVKFNANGSVAFYRVYEHPHQFPAVGPVCEALDGSRYVMAITNSVSNDFTGSPLNGTTLISFDLNGNLLTQRGFAPLDAAHEAPVAIIPTADGGFAALSARPDARGATLRRFTADASASTLEKIVKPTAGFVTYAANSLTQTADGGFLIGGRAPSRGATGEDAMLMKLSGAGVLEFVSLLGGPANEGGPYSNGPGAAVALEVDGGYALACTTQSYKTGTPNKPDWWVVKTDANRTVRNFAGNMQNQALSEWTVTGSPQTPVVVSVLSNPNYTASPFVTLEPDFVAQDTGALDPPSRPTIGIQGSSPRILSSRSAEAIVNQHFSYHIVADFFPAGASLTYSAQSLPQGFVIDPETGVISGVPRPGSETVTPLSITVSVTDGVDTATGAFGLTIGEGLPVLTVNGSSSPTPNLNDKVLTFEVEHSGKLAGRAMSIQATTGSPSDEAGWQVLPDGASLLFDRATKRYVLSTLNYPLQGSVYFRARLGAPGFEPRVYSPPVGPFNLVSNITHLAAPALKIRTNTPNADMEFHATQPALVSAIQVRVQSTKTPGDEATWTDLTNSTAGIMRQSDTNPNVFILLVSNQPPGAALYFRAVAAAPGFVDGLSLAHGPLYLIPNKPPVVNITLPNGSGAGTAESPRVVTAGILNFSATATVPSDRQVTSLVLRDNGKVLTPPSGTGNGSLTIQYTTSALGVGDHLIDAVAIDDFGGRSRAGTSPLYLRVKPPAAANAPTAGGSTDAAAANGKMFTVVNSGGYWHDPATWKDEQGNFGVPGANDFAVIGAATVICFDPEFDGFVVHSASINGGKLVGPSFLQVTGLLTISGGVFENNMGLHILIGGVVELTNRTDLLFTGGTHGTGSFSNAGTVNVHGSGGLAGVSDFRNRGTVNWLAPLTVHPNAGLDPAASLRKIEAAAVKLETGKILGSPKILPLPPAMISAVKAGLIGNDGGGLIGNDGGGLIGNDGGGLIGNDGAGLIGNDGGGLVAQGGGNLVAQGGGNLVAQGGGNLVAQGGGNRPASAPSESAAAGVAAPGIVISGGEIDLTAVALVGSVALDGGVLKGTGSIRGDLANHGGFISPGNSPGLITVDGSFTQGANGTLIVQAAGAEDGHFDRLQVGGAATLGGKLEVYTINGYVPLPDDPFNPLGYSTASGAFASTSGNVAVDVNASGVLATVDPNAPNPGVSLVSAVSRKTHGEQGPFDIALPLTGPVGVEPRRSDTVGQHQIIFTFSVPITAGGATLSSGVGSVSSYEVSGATVTVNLTGVTNQQIVTISLTNVNNGTTSISPSLSIGVLLGDSNGDGSVNSGDAIQTRSRSGQSAAGTNFRSDANSDGTINTGDATVVRSRSGSTIYP